MAESFVGGMLGGAGGALLGTLYVELTANSVKLVKGMAEAEMSIKHGAGAMLKEIGALGAEVTAGLALIGGVAVEEFAKFDKAMMRSLAVMEKVSPALRKEMEETARGIAKNSITSAEELAASYGTLAQAGLTVEQSMLAIGKVNELARTGTISMTEATDLLTESQASLGMKVNDTAQNMENMTRVSDVLVKASTLTTASVKQLGEALIGKTGASLRTVGKDVEEGVAILAVYARQGIKAGEAGQSLSLVLRELEVNAIKNRDVFEKYGIAVFDANGKMRDMADIMDDVEKSLHGGSDEMQRASLASLGFQQRTAVAIQALIGFSGEIRKYEEALRNAGGTTEQVAADQMEAFHSQLQISTNRIKDLLITIGEGLEPSLKLLNEMLQTFTNTNTAANESIKESANVYGTGLVYAIKAVIMVFEGWRDLLKLVAIGMLQLVEWVIQGCGKMAQGIAYVINRIIKGVESAINGVITAINYWIDKLPDWIQEELGASTIPEVKFKASVQFNKEEFDRDIGMLEDAKKEIWDSLVKTSVDAAEAVKPPLKEIGDSFDGLYLKEVEAQKGLLNATNNMAKGAGILAEEAKKAKEELDKLLTVLDKLGAPKTPLQSMGFTDQKDLDTLMKMGVSEGTLKELSAVPKHTLDASGISDSSTSQSYALTQEMEQAQNRLKLLNEMGNNEVQLTEEVQQRKLAAIEAYNRKLKDLQTAQTLVILTASQQMFDSLAGAVEGFAGRQSTVYKAMFAASKAFAIAEAIVKIQQGIAEAISLPWPANIAAVASVVAAAAGIVSTISATKLEIEGGKAAGGPVRGGRNYVVGERGPEIFSPASSGTIIPNDRIAGGGGGVRVVVNNYTDATATTSERNEGQERVIEVVIKRLKTEIGSEVRDGRGEISRAMESSFGLRRGTR